MLVNQKQTVKREPAASQYLHEAAGPGQGLHVNSFWNDLGGKITFNITLSRESSILLHQHDVAIKMPVFLLFEHYPWIIDGYTHQRLQGCAEIKWFSLGVGVELQATPAESALILTGLIFMPAKTSSSKTCLVPKEQLVEVMHVVPLYPPGLCCFCKMQTVRVFLGKLSAWLSMNFCWWYLDKSYQASGTSLRARHQARCIIHMISFISRCMTAFQSRYFYVHFYKKTRARRN